MLNYEPSIMNYPLRNESNANKEWQLNDSTPSSSDGSEAAYRSLGSSLWNSQGLYNQEDYNMQTIANTSWSRNARFGGPFGGAHQSRGNVAPGRYSLNMGIGQSELSHGGLHGHSSMTNRTGISVARNRSFSKSVNGVGGSGVGYPGKSSISYRGSRSGMGGSPSQMGSVGPRIVNSFLGILEASPQAISSSLGNSFFTTPSSDVQGQLHLVTCYGGGMGLTSDGNTNDGVGFDTNDFPQLTPRHSPCGNVQGAVGGLREQGVGVNANVVQHDEEFSIWNEDFPALPGGSHEQHHNDQQQRNDQQHHKDPQHDLAAMQSQHFRMGPSTGFRGSYASKFLSPEQQQLRLQQPAGNASDLQHLHGGVGDSFSLARGLSDSYHSQTIGPPGAGATQVQLSRVGGALGQYDQSLNHQHQSPLRAGGASIQQQQQMGMGATFPDTSRQGGSTQQPDQFGLLGLSRIIGMSDPEQTMFSLDTDLTTLGLNLSSSEKLYKTFASPWADERISGEPDFVVPPCYHKKAPELKSSDFIMFQENTLFYIFYSMPRDEVQLYAADELSNRGWSFHKELKRWLKCAPNSEPLVKTPAYERDTFFFLDPTTLEMRCKENFVLYYDMVEKRPKLPTQL